MRELRRLITLTLLVTASLSSASPAKQGEPLKDAYKLNGAYNWFYRTDKVADGYSYICDMGQALPDPEQDGWYTNKPIPGLRLELRTRLRFESHNGETHPMGFVVIVKGDEILKEFKPLGKYVSGVWIGDAFNSWRDDATDIAVYSGLEGVEGFAKFDILSGNGFYYKSLDAEKPAYFLSDCRRILKKNLPVYDWKD